MIYYQEQFMNPETYFGFMKLFGIESNKDILISLLNAVLQEKRNTIIDLNYLNTKKFGPYYGNGNFIIDVICTTKSNGHFVVEIQNSKEFYFKANTFYYTSSPYYKLEKNNQYDFHDVCIVGILDFVFFEEKNLVNNYLHNIKTEVCDNNQNYKTNLDSYYIEMPKFNKEEAELNNMLDKWLFAIKKLCFLDEQPKVLTEQIFNKFFHEAKIELLTPEENFAYFQSRMHYWDNRNTIAYSYEKGMESGIAKEKELGIAEGKKETAKKMLSMGMDKEVILQITGLTETELHDINSE